MTKIICNENNILYGGQKKGTGDTEHWTLHSLNEDDGNYDTLTSVRIQIWSLGSLVKLTVLKSLLFCD